MRWVRWLLVVGVLVGVALWWFGLFGDDRLRDPYAHLPLNAEVEVRIPQEGPVRSADEKTQLVLRMEHRYLIQRDWRWNPPVDRVWFAVLLDSFEPTPMAVVESPNVATIEVTLGSDRFIARSVNPADPERSANLMFYKPDRSDLPGLKLLTSANELGEIDGHPRQHDKNLLYFGKRNGRELYIDCTIHTYINPDQCELYITLDEFRRPDFDDVIPRLNVTFDKSRLARWGEIVDDVVAFVRPKISVSRVR